MKDKYCIEVTFELETGVEMTAELHEAIINALEDALNKRDDIAEVEALNMDLI